METIDEEQIQDQEQEQTGPTLVIALQVGYASSPRIARCC